VLLSTINTLADENSFRAAHHFDRLRSRILISVALETLRKRQPVVELKKAK